MNIGWMMVPLLCVSGVAMAQAEGDPAKIEEPVAKVATEVSPHYRMEKRRHVRLPNGDLRHCLKLKSSREIIRCSESRSKK